MGRPAEAVAHLPLVADLGGDEGLLILGTRPSVHSRAWLAHAYWLLGRDADADACAQEAIDRARCIEEPFSLVVSLGYGAITAQLQGRRDEVERQADEVARMCDRYGFAYYGEWARLLRGWATGGGQGVDLARAGIAHLKATGALARMPYWLALLAELLADRGAPQDAAATLDAALVIGRAHDDLWWLPEVLRLRARCDGDGAVGRDRLRAARAMAVQHGSVALVRRCDVDAGR